MFGLGMGELIVILIVALLFVGPEKLPELARSVGKGIRDLRRHTRDLQETIEQDETLGGTVRELRSALRGDPDWVEPPQRIRPPPTPPTPAVSAPATPAPPPDSGTARDAPEAPETGGSEAETKSSGSANG